MVQVAAGSGPGAAGCGAPGTAGPDEVLELAAGPVPGFRMLMVAAAAGDRGQPDSQGAQVVPGSGVGRWLWWFWAGWFRAGWFGAGWFRARGWRGVAAGCAAVGGGGPVRVQDGDAPAGVRAAPGRGEQVAGGAGVQQPEPGGLARYPER